MAPCVGEDDINEARSRLRLLEACEGFEVTFFRDKYPALDGIIHITQSSALVTELSNVLVAFQLKSKSRSRQDNGRLIQLPVSDVDWILSLPIPTVLFVADLKTASGIYVKWLTAEKKPARRRMSPGATPAAEPTRAFTPEEEFSVEKFKKDAFKFAKALIPQQINYAPTVAQ